MNKSKYEDFYNTYYEPLKKLDFRLYNTSPDERERNNYNRDYARVLYSNSFKRLQGKMQLFGVTEDKFYRNRLTHSMEVAQISRSIAHELNRFFFKKDDFYTTDIYVLETGSLAHDIGNPPFGHKGERILNNLLKTNGGFEGNAQGIRILSKLEKKFPDKKGLDLTLRTLLSIVKYYKPYYESLDSKFLYLDDYLDFQRHLTNDLIKPRTLDVQIIDLADEIAYCAHDLEDALSLSHFTIEELLFEIKLSNEEVYGEFKKWVEHAHNYALQSKNYNSSEEYAFVFRKQLTSIIVHNLIRDIDIIEVDDDFINVTATNHKYELGFKSLKALAKILKTKTFSCVNRRPEIQLYEKLGEKVIKGLFTTLTDTDFNKGMILLPVEYRTSNTENYNRAVADYISGMMDKYAINLYKKIHGPSSLDSFKID